jgi:superfamily I DNA and/or RNA helicase
MVAISIWFRSQGKKPEKVDEASSRKEASILLREYRMAFGVMNGGHRVQKDKMWMGRRKDEPNDP